MVLKVSSNLNDSVILSKESYFKNLLTVQLALLISISLVYIPPFNPPFFQIKTMTHPDQDVLCSPSHRGLSFPSSSCLTENWLPMSPELINLLYRAVKHRWAVNIPVLVSSCPLNQLPAFRDSVSVGLQILNHQILKQLEILGSFIGFAWLSFGSRGYRN